MELTNEDIINFYKTKIQPFVAVFILAFVMTTAYLLWQDNQLKEEISNNCGWETKDYKCYCDKSFVENLEIKLNNSLNLTFGNVTLDRGSP